MAELELFGEARFDPIEIVEYDPRWPAGFAALRSRVAGALRGAAVRVDHVGSTAVPGLEAKPIIDVQVSVADLDDEASYRPGIEALGWPLRAREPGHRLFRPPPPEPRVTHVHVCELGSEWERAHLLFRDYLRAHPERAITYGQLKRELARRFRDERIAYTDAKDDFVEETLTLANRWAKENGWVP